jgi:hypothetical protein
MTPKARQTPQKLKDDALPLGPDNFDNMMRKALQVPLPSQLMPGQRKAKGGRNTKAKGRRQDA